MSGFSYSLALINREVGPRLITYRYPQSLIPLIKEYTLNHNIKVPIS